MIILNSFKYYFFQTKLKLIDIFHQSLKLEKKNHCKCIEINDNHLVSNIPMHFNTHNIWYVN